MRETDPDRSDPGVRAALELDRFERRQRAGRCAAALGLVAMAVAGPFVAATVVGNPGATVAAIIAAPLFAGLAVAAWPWAWSDAERDHHTLAAIWAQARPVAEAHTPWDRYAAWAKADDDRVELLLVTCAGTDEPRAAPSPFASRSVRRLDAEAIADATVAMEDLRAEAAALEARARRRHADAVAAAARKPYDDALREVDETAAQRQRSAEAQMRREVAEQQAAERRAQASAVARALRRP
jgi:hypothetical protein